MQLSFFFESLRRGRPNHALHSHVALILIKVDESRSRDHPRAV